LASKIRENKGETQGRAEPGYGFGCDLEMGLVGCCVFPGDTELGVPGIGGG